MKRVLVLLVGIAVAISFITMAHAADSKFKTKERAKIDTGNGVEKIKTTSITNGQFTTEKGKIIMTPNSGDVKVEKLKFKSWSDNDPANDSDNTVIMYKGKEEVVRHVGKDIKANHLKALDKTSGTIYSTYNLANEAWEITAIER